MDGPITNANPTSFIGQLPMEWNHILDHYRIDHVQGSGSFGQVVKAYSKQGGDGKPVAIKYIKDAFKSLEGCKRVYREIAILRQLSRMANNIFTIKLFDVIIPPEVEQQLTKLSKQQLQSQNLNLPGLFLVVSWVDKDLKQIFNVVKPPSFDVDHVKIILYNILCSINYIQTANIVHRDLKPGNILVKDNCGVRLCDFGLARTMPKTLDQLVGSVDSQQLTGTSGVMTTHETTEESVSGSEFSFNIHSKQEYVKVEEKDKVRIAQMLDSNRDKRRQARRQLTPQVASRWYRAPELIIMEKNYSNRVDLWSVGCILAELMSYSDEMGGAGRDYTKRILFPGHNCFPLSPCPEFTHSNSTSGTTNINENDQYIKIFEQLSPVPNSLDFSFFTEQSAFDYTHQIMSQVKPSQKHTSLSETNNQNVLIKQLQDLLQQLVQFNPYYRTSVKGCIGHPLFDDIRKQNLEHGAPFQIFLKCDQIDSYDYSKNKDNYAHNGIIDYYQMIVDEQGKLRKLKSKSGK